MKNLTNKQVAVFAFLLGFGIMSFLLAATFMVIAEDLRDEVIDFKKECRRIDG